MVNFFDYYLNLGLRIIPLYPKSKQPIGCGWNLDWDKDRIKSMFEAHPHANLGLLLGEIVDVEGDDDAANATLNDLIGDYPHPHYTSSKSVHHLFINPDPELTRIAFKNIEFRANKHQSVLPPSTHPSGSKYIWLCQDFPVPPMPPALMEFYEGIRLKPKKLQVRKAVKGFIKPWCGICEKRILFNKRRYIKEKLAFESLGYGWQCPSCRTVDVRKACKKRK